MPNRSGYLLNISAKEKIAFLLLAAFRFFNWMLVDETYSKLLIGLPLFIYLLQIIRIFCIKPNNIEDELQVALAKEQQTKKSDLDVAIALRNLQVTNSNQVKITGFFFEDDDLNQSIKYELEWHVGNGEIYNHLKEIVSILDALQKKQLLGKSAPEKPWQLQNRYRFLLPRVSVNCDMVSKARLLELFAIPMWYVSGHIAEMLLLGNYKTEFRVMYTAISWFLCRIENYFAHELDLRLHSEGWKEKNPPWFPNTCIGQQIRETYNFYPESKEFRAITRFIFESEHLFDKLLHEKSSEIPPDLHRTLKDFHRLTRETDVIHMV